MSVSRPQSAISALSGSHTVPAGGLAALGARPSQSDLRPYSSASMYNPDLAIKYANKHGKKPLPYAPSPAVTSMGFDNSGLVQVSQQQQQHIPMQGYDQTMMPGQFLPMGQQPQQPQQQQYAQLPLAQQQLYQQQQQQQVLPYGVGARPVSLDSGMTAGAMHMENVRLQQQLEQYQHQLQPQQQQFLPSNQQEMYQQQYQQQEPPLMNLFAPPPGTEISPQSKMLPNSMQPVAPTFTPAYNPSFANNAVPQQQLQQQQPGKSLPAPPQQPMSNGPNNVSEAQALYGNPGYVMEQQPGEYMYQPMGEYVQGMAYSQQQPQQMIYGSVGPSSISQPYSQQQPQMLVYQQQQPQIVYAAEYPQNQQMMHPQQGYVMEPSAPM
ncbi:hypothetical protein IWW38_005125, partial [Coemansia aciculifera]